MTKNFVCHSLYLRNHKTFDCHLRYTSGKLWYLHAFFHFFKISMFWVIGRVKGIKITQNDKKLWLSHLISQEAYIIWSSFLVHMCKRIISQACFVHFFQILIFRVNSGVKGKTWPKMTQNYGYHTPYLRKHTSYVTVIFGTQL